MPGTRPTQKTIEGGGETKLRRLGRTLLTIAKDYLVIVRGRSEGAGLATLKSLSVGGPLNWIGLSVLMICVLGTAYLAPQAQRFSTLRAELWEGEWVAGPAPSLYLALFALSFGWAYLLTGAAASNLGIYALLADYAAFFALYVGMGGAVAPWFAAIPLWVLMLGVWSASARPTRWRVPFLLLLCFIVALFTRNALGLGRLLPGTWGVLVLGVLYAALAVNPWALSERRFRPNLAFWITLIIFSSFYALCLHRLAPEEVFSNLFLSLHNLLGLLSLFWFWLGLDLFNSGRDVAEWLVGTIRALLPIRILEIAIFLLWAIWCTLSYLLAYGPPPASFALVPDTWGLNLMRTWGDLQTSRGMLVTVLEFDLYPTAAVALVALVLRWRSKLDREGLLRLFGLTVVALIVIWGYFALFFAFGSADPGKVLGFWPLLVFGGGMFFQMLQVAGALVSQSHDRSALFMGFLLLLGAVALLELSAGYPYFEQELSLNTFLGVLYLGLPYLLYTYLYGGERHTPVASKRLLTLFALGMLSAIPSLVWGWLFLGPLIWVGVLAAMAWRVGRWDTALDGVSYGVALALGFVIYYTHPIIIPLPAFAVFLGPFLQGQSEYAARVIWPWDVAWWWVLAGAAGAAVMVGYLMTRACQAQGHRRLLYGILGPVLGVALLFLWQLVLLPAY